MERRALLSASAQATLSVLGTSGDDQISIYVAGGIATVTVNGVPTSELDALVTQISVNALEGDDTIRVEQNTDNTILVNAGNDDDTIIFADSAGSLSALGTAATPISVDAGAGNDSVEFDDSARSETARYLVSGAAGPSQLQLNLTDTGGAALAPTITSTSLERALVRAGAGDDSITVMSAAPPISLSIDAGLGDDAVSVSGDGGLNQPVTVIGNAGLDDLQVNGFSATPIVVEGSGSQDWDQLLVQGNARLKLGQNTSDVHRIKLLSISATSVLDVGRSTLVYDYSGPSPLQTVANQIKSGYAGGAWTGKGIASSFAGNEKSVGYAASTSLFSQFPATFAGVQVDETTVLIRYTLAGDANLDRTVGIADFARTAASFNTSTLWVDGDFNFDGTTDIGDFSLLAAAFNNTLAAAAVQAAPSVQSSAHKLMPTKPARLIEDVL